MDKHLNNDAGDKTIDKQLNKVAGNRNIDKHFNKGVKLDVHDLTDATDAHGGE